jgi:flagellin-specific chaperone FliS
LFTEKYKHILQVFDGIFSKCRIASCHITENDIEELQNFVAEAMRLWRGLQLNITPKAHAADDHICDQICILYDIGDLTKVFVEQSHQTGIRHNQRSQSMKDNSKSAKWHVRWEEKETRN